MKPLEADVDWKTLQTQIAYLAKIRRLPTGKLKKLHKETFPHGHKYYQKAPAWTPRYYLERRLYFYFCALHYHLPDPYRQEFWRKADDLLRHYVSEETRPTDMDVVRELTDFRKFTPDGITALPEHRVDAFLLRLGYLVDGLPLDQKRQILFELYHMHRGDVVPRYSMATGKPVKYTVSRLNVRRLILENPTLGYKAIVEKYGASIGKLTKGTFYQARRALKLAGYEIPKLRRDITGVIVDGKATNLGKQIQTVSRSHRQPRETPVGLSEVDEGDEEEA